MKTASIKTTKANLTNREQKVLQATVDRYIATAEPVGSKTLAEEYNFDVSPATIRNVLNVLDRLGLLYQPHTSAGRIPSDSGYRVYVDGLVDELLERDRGIPGQMAFVAPPSLPSLGKPAGAVSSGDLDALLQALAKSLAALCGCIALIAAPNVQTAKLRHVQLILLDARQAMLVAVSDAYHTASVVVELPPDLSVADLELELPPINNFLNERLRDRRFSEIGSLRWEDLDRSFRQYAALVERALQSLTHLYGTPSLGSLFVCGITELMRQPEFGQLNQMQAVIQLLEDDREALFPLLLDGMPSSNDSAIHVKIGTEMPLEPIQTCAFVSTTYYLEETPAGIVGVLGPTRLDYRQAIAAVRTVASQISAALSPRSAIARD